MKLLVWWFKILSWFKVKIEDDLSVEQIRQTAFSASKTVTSEDDMFVLAILSHGEVNEEIVGTDGFKISTKDIVEIFNNERCPELKTKPKLFIIQACRLENSTQTNKSPGIQLNNDCRGDELDYGVSKPKCATEQDSAPIRRDDRMPTDTDILVAYASYAGKASYRLVEEHLINDKCRNKEKRVKPTSLRDELKLVYKK